VAVLRNLSKNGLFTAEERVEMLREVLKGQPNVRVARFDGLTVDFCHAVGAEFIVRGLRAISDFESEMQLAHNNRKLAHDVDTVFFMTALEHGYVSSSLVKEIAMFGGDVSAMIPAAAAVSLGEALGRLGRSGPG
jgi:pantetheine-phosphate adenylyltransferase